MRQQSSRYNGRTERGGVMVEFAITLPLLILFVMVALLVGRLMVQATWFIQSGYQAAHLGAITNQNDRMTKMQTLLGTLKHLHSESTPIRTNEITVNGQSSTATFLDGTSSVTQDGITANLSGSLVQPSMTMARLFGLGNVALNVSFTGAPLMLDIPRAGTLNAFVNPAQQYKCNGDIGTSTSCHDCTANPRADNC